MLKKELTGKETRMLVMKLKQRVKLKKKKKVTLSKDESSPFRAPKDVAKMIPKIKAKAPPGPTPPTIKEVIREAIDEVKASPPIKPQSKSRSPILEACPKMGSKLFQAIVQVICMNAFLSEATVRQRHPDELLAEILTQRYKIKQTDW
ncbi:MAG: hypothetical protein ACFFCW_04265 [Candidatus Hodarchaeota archaeon]